MWMIKTVEITDSVQQETNNTMVINCYYHFPEGQWNTSTYFEALYNSLKNKYTEYTINKVDSRKLPNLKSSSGCAKYSYSHMIIENQENKKYFLVTYWDKMNCINNNTGWDMENCVEIITSSGTHKDDLYYEPLPLKFTPFSYTTSRVDVDKKIYELRDTNNANRIIPQNPMFRGYLYLFRNYLKKDDRFDIQSNGERDFLGYTDYIKHLNKYAINMSLNGAGQICFRDMEILGLGTALFRPKLSSNFHNQLIPDYHYISVDYDHIKNIKNTNEYYGELKELIIKRWDEVIKDRDFIDEVASNGKKWFDENVPKEKQSEILIKIINFNKLK